MDPNDRDFSQDLPIELFERYVSGFASEREQEQIRAWASQSSVGIGQLRALEHAIAERRERAADVDVTLAWQRMREWEQDVQPKTLRRGTHTTTATGRVLQASTPRSLGWTALACALVAIGLGTWMMRTGYSKTGSEQIFATTPGQQMTVRIADDTRVVLAPATTMRVTTQRILLDGEAYFQVTPRSERAITIRTSHADVRVLGTRFVVRAYPGERTSRVVVEDGKVTLRAWRVVDARAASAIMTARTLAVISDSTVVVTPGIAVSDYTGWTRGQLAFDNAPLGDVIAELARVYGANIRVEDSILAHQPLTMAVSVRSEPLGQLLEFVGRVAGARVTRVGEAFVLVRGRASTPDARFHRFPQPERQYGK